MDYDNQTPGTGGKDWPSNAGCASESPVDSARLHAQKQAYYDKAQCKAAIEVPTIVRDLRRRMSDLEQQRNAIDTKLHWCKELLSIFN